MIHVSIHALRCAPLSFLGMSIAFAQSQPETASITVGGKTIGIQYSAPSVRGRKIFGPGGLLTSDPTYPAWRAGANDATAFHTTANLQIGALNVPNK